MNKKLLLLFAAVTTTLFQGCIAIPPLIQVQHKDNGQELSSRLDSIERRLERLEQKPASEAK